jgi:hypothetical protein
LPASKTPNIIHIMLKTVLLDKKVITILFLLLVVVATYVSFTAYRPKSLTEVPEVRGYKQKSDDVFSIPYPVDTVKISDAKTTDTRQVTMQTTQSEEDMQKFYDAILTDEGWEIETENQGKIFYTVKYKKDGNFITISTSQQKEGSEITIVSIEVQKYN